jgi:hypothetical protein
MSHEVEQHGKPQTICEAQPRLIHCFGSRVPWRTGNLQGLPCRPQRQGGRVQLDAPNRGHGLLLGTPLHPSQGGARRHRQPITLLHAREPHRYCSHSAQGWQTGSHARFCSQLPPLLHAQHGDGRVRRRHVARVSADQRPRQVHPPKGPPPVAPDRLALCVLRG